MSNIWTKMNDGLDKAAKPLSIAGMISSSLFCLYTSGTGMLSALDQRSVHWLLLGVPLFLMYSWKGKNKKIDILDYLCALLLVASCIYLMATWRNDILLLKQPSFWDTTFGIICVLMVLEATRRTLGNSIPIISIIMIIYALFGGYFPAAMKIKSFSVQSLTSYLFRTTEGIFGQPIGVSTQFILIFILFGAFLAKTGAGQLFVDIALSATGRLRSGPAQATIFANILMGLISSTPVANVATVGSFTLPLLKRTKYPDIRAASLLAVSATGAMFTPPIMGACAFLIADYMGVPYGEVVMAGIMPAILFYVSLIISADVVAARSGLEGMRREDMPDWKAAFMRRGQMLLPIVVLVYFIIAGYSVPKSAFFCIVLLVVLALFRKETRLDLQKLVGIMVSGTKEAIPIGAVCACSGIIVGVISCTGIGVKFSSFLLAISQGNAFFALFLTMIAALILGLGLGPPSVYLILAALTIPALITIGVEPMSAHFFVFYYAVMGVLTPPVAMAAFTAAGMAKTDPTKTGWISFGMGFVAYVIPFVFAYSPALLFRGSSMLTSAYVIFTTLLGVLTLTFAVEGFIRRKVKLLPRLLFVIASVGFFVPENFLFNAMGLAVGVAAIILYRVTTRKDLPAVYAADDQVVDVSDEEIAAKAAEFLRQSEGTTGD
ncbi:MAG TPA: TRAP transporter fused permease subunit [Anaerovoracaceae bacterium]|nr:TRAP transporter fused permease subunit [Anaerovoracaceae bacterium]